MKLKSLNLTNSTLHHAKFSENSNGFRPNRSAETAIAQCMRLIQVQHLYHVVDLDIKGFFDNISHTKLVR